MFTITRTHLFTRWTLLPTREDQMNAEWIATTLRFLISYNETLTGNQFADRVEQHCDTANPKTAFAAAFLRSIDARRCHPQQLRLPIQP